MSLIVQNLVLDRSFHVIISEYLALKLLSLQWMSLLCYPYPSVNRLSDYTGYTKSMKFKGVSGSESESPEEVTSASASVWTENIALRFRPIFTALAV